MNSNLKRHRDSIIRRLFPWQSSKFNSTCPKIKSGAEFDLLIRKEIARCIRRPRDNEFALVEVESPIDFLGSQSAPKIISELGDRLRITDEMGIVQDKFSVLLPETGRDGGLEVANLIDRIAETNGQRLQVSIKVYPWNDSISGRSTELDSVDLGGGVGSRWKQLPLSFEDVNDSRIDHVSENNNRMPIEIATPKPFCLRTVKPTPLWKRTMDVTCSSILLVVLSPLFALIAVLIRLDSPGRAIFVQLREGKDARLFNIFKFRTMRVDAELLQQNLRGKSEQDGPAFKLEYDPRITRVGRLLRKTCLDELPQLVNIFKGEMSFVGPRPLPVDESYQCKMWHRQRLQVLPGLTCTWQVFGGRSVTFEEWMRMDLEYIKKQSFLLDMKLIGLTAFKVILQKGSV